MYRPSSVCAIKVGNIHNYLTVRRHDSVLLQTDAAERANDVLSRAVDTIKATVTLTDENIIVNTFCYD